MPKQLTINSAPFKSSNLAIPPTPFTPRLPTTPPASPPPRRAASAERPKPNIQFSPPPSEPLHWLWQCHVCSRVYQLGVTRRCLDDGHLFCAGTTVVKRSRKTGKTVKKHKACASEFDYAGWKSWGVWRRSVIEQIEAAEALIAATEADGDVVLPLNVPTAPSEEQGLKGAWTREPVNLQETKNFWHKDCWNSCDYPSECRWGKQYGVQTPSLPTVPSSPPETLVGEPEKPKTSFDDILLDCTNTEASTAEHIKQLKPTHQTTGTPGVPQEQTRKPSLDDLLESAKRRKRRSVGQVPSPLASHPPSPTSAETLAAVAAGEEQPTESASASGSYLQKALDDFELDVRKSLGRAGGLVTSWASSIRSTAALEEKKAETFVKGLGVNKKKAKADVL